MSYVLCYHYIELSLIVYYLLIIEKGYLRSSFLYISILTSETSGNTYNFESFCQPGTSMFSSTARYDIKLLYCNHGENTEVLIDA